LATGGNVSQALVKIFFLVKIKILSSVPWLQCEKISIFSEVD
jgi:hypothetical protein